MANGISAVRHFLLEMVCFFGTNIGSHFLCIFVGNMLQWKIR
ncbi:hypothetical protein B4119_3576 [Parageobacillus caldoxylosilyticus]|uniref:Uncharacterized protein n=1 Tax=Saccharococcus caldoxylosilyticus TaxID=81408 RepID=A0A150M4Z9_9BACL|nr:hypothetical protein B4119_3576 [Parageobacillus caldoxylosilyticus]